MSADKTPILPEDDAFEPAPLPDFETVPDVLDDDADIEAELWEALDDRAAAPFIAGSYTAETLQANLSAVAMATADDMQANLSAVGIAKTDWFESIGSVVGAAVIDGDAEVSTSAVPLLIAKGDADFHQAYASAFVAGGTVRVHQGGSPLMIAKALEVEQGGSALMLAGDVKVRRSIVGVLFARRAEMSEDTRVLVTGKGAALISAALFGGLMLAAFAVLHGISGMRPGTKHGHGRHHR